MTNAIITAQAAADELYMHGKVCITATRAARIDFKYRPYLALFADGTFLVDERAQTDAVLQNMALEFCAAYPSRKKWQKQYVSPSLLKAVYHKAQDFDWYLPQNALPPDLTPAERHKLQNFLARVLARRCLSITTLTTPDWFRFHSPDKEKFALFADGWLVVAQNSPNLGNLPNQISRLYPQIQMVEVVPEYYIGAIYEKLLYTEPSAREIYINQVHKKIMQRLSITAAEALEVMQKQTHGWRRLLFLSEPQARSMIYSNHVENCFIRDDAAFAAQMNAQKDFHIGTFI